MPGKQSNTTAPMSGTSKASVNMSQFSDYEYNVTFFNNLIEYLTNDWYMDQTLIYLTNLINIAATPLVIILGIIANISCVLAFSNPQVKSVVYRFLLYNSGFDLCTLGVALARLFTGFFRSTMLASSRHTGLVELVFFIYVPSVTLCCSNLVKIAIAFERIGKLSRTCNSACTRAAFRHYVMPALIVGAVLLNAPVLFGYRLFSDAWSKQSYFLMTLNQRGAKSSLGLLLVINAIVLDVGVFALVLVANVTLLVVVRLHVRRLAALSASAEASAAASTSGAGRIHLQLRGDLDDESDNDDGDCNGSRAVDVIVVSHIGDERISYVAEAPRSCKTTMAPVPLSFALASQESVEYEAYSVPPSPTVLVAAAATGNNSASSSSKSRKTVEEKLALQRSKVSLSRMIVIYSAVFLFGHVLFSLCAVFIQMRYFYYFGPFMNINTSQYFIINLVIAASYFCLYASFFVNFFVYYKFDGLFNGIVRNHTLDDETNNAVGIVYESEATSRKDSIVDFQANNK